MTSFGHGFQGSHDLLHGNVHTKVYGELINFAASYSRFIAMLFYGLAVIKIRFSSVQLSTGGLIPANAAVSIFL